MSASIRAALVKRNLASLERNAGADAPRALAELGEELVARTRASTLLDWLPLEFDVEMSEVSVGFIGVDGDRARARATLGQVFQTPLLRPFITSAKVLFGSFEPRAVLRQIPRGFHACYREAGRIHYFVDDGARRLLRYEDVPACVLHSEPYQEAFAGALEAVFELCRTQGEITVTEVDLERRRIDLCARWW